jgi:hypothetical protein
MAARKPVAVWVQNDVALVYCDDGSVWKHNVRGGWMSESHPVPGSQRWSELTSNGTLNREPPRVSPR